MKNDQVTAEKALTTRQMAAEAAEKRFSKQMLKWSDACKDKADDPKADMALQLALHEQNSFVLGTDPLAIRLHAKRQKQALKEKAARNRAIGFMVEINIDLTK